jgi:hypothetical protein
MSSNDIYFEQEVKRYQDKLINSIKGRLVELFKQALEETVYDYYNPTTYERTNRLKDSVTVKFDNATNTLYIYPDITNGYVSAVDGRDVSLAVPYWIQSGHSDNTGINNQYHSYEGRDYLQRAKELIDKEFKEYGFDIEIINDQPSRV